LVQQLDFFKWGKRERKRLCNKSHNAFAEFALKMIQTGDFVVVVVVIVCFFEHFVAPSTDLTAALPMPSPPSKGNP
jgi:hypothetical protein